MINNIVGIALIVLGMVVLICPKVLSGGIFTVAGDTNANGWDVLKAIVDKLPIRILTGLLLIVLGIVVINPSLLPWMH